MDRHTFTFDTEAREQHLQRLVDARIYATEADILAGRKAVIAAVAEKTGEQHGDRSLNCDVDEAEALVRAAVLGRASLVGARIAEVILRRAGAHIALTAADGE